MKKSKTPRLRFPQFNGDWASKEVSQLLNSVSKRVDVNPTTEYQEIGIRSHGKGIFYKDPVVGKKLGNKRVFWIVEEAFILNIVFAWEQAIAKTTSKEVGLIASHRFPMYRPKRNAAYLDFIHFFFLTKRGKYLLEMASPGGAGRNKTLGKTRFMELSFRVPNVKEQQKIADFLTTVNQKIQQLRRKKELLVEYKKGVMQKLFPSADGQAPEIRFKDENGEDFPDWESRRLGKIGTFSKGKGIAKKDVEDNGKHKCIRYGELYTEYKEKIDGIKSRTNLPAKKLAFSKSNDVLIPSSGETHIDIATASCVLEDGVALGGDINIFRTNQNGNFISYYLKHAYKHQIASLAQGNSVIHLYSKQLKSLEILLPSIEEQNKIVDFLEKIDDKVQSIANRISSTQHFKKGLLQQMFV